MGCGLLENDLRTRGQCPRGCEHDAHAAVRAVGERVLAQVQGVPDDLGVLEIGHQGVHI